MTSTYSKPRQSSLALLQLATGAGRCRESVSPEQRRASAIDYEISHVDAATLHDANAEEQVRRRAAVMDRLIRDTLADEWNSSSAVAARDLVQRRNTLQHLTLREMRDSVTSAPGPNRPSLRVSAEHVESLGAEMQRASEVVLQRQQAEGSAPPSQGKVETHGAWIYSRYGVRYGPLLFWFTLITTTLWIVDRFTLNVWPRNYFRDTLRVYGDKSAGGDRIGALKPGPWTIQVYDALARFSGRLMTAALNTMIWTMMHSTHFWLSESILARRRWVDFADSAWWTLFLHRFWGWLIGLSLMPHIYSILLPCIFNGYTSVVTAGPFEWPLSERRAAGTKDVDNDAKIIGLQLDDVWRLVEMTLMFGVFIPWSIRAITSNYRIGIMIHRAMYLMFFIDIMRRHSHPHNWVLNGPVFLLWLADVWVAQYWKRDIVPARRFILSPDYMILFWTQPVRIGPSSGPEFLLKLDGHWWERKHPFTGFQNTGGLKPCPLAIVRPSWRGHVWHVVDGVLIKNDERAARDADAASAEDTDISDTDWQCGLVARIYHADNSHTRKIAEAPSPTVNVCGPFEGSMSADIDRRLRETEQLVIVAGGSGAGYLLDCIQNHMMYGHCPVLFLFTTRDVGLFQWFTWMLEEMQAGQKDPVCSASAQLGSTIAALTARKVAVVDTEDITMTNAMVQLGRLDFEALLEPLRDVPTSVFCQGSSGIITALGKACQTHGCRLHAGASYDNESPKRAIYKEAGEPRSSTMSTAFARIAAGALGALRPSFAKDSSDDRDAIFDELHPERRRTQGSMLALHGYPEDSRVVQATGDASGDRDNVAFNLTAASALSTKSTLSAEFESTPGTPNQKGRRRGEKGKQSEQSIVFFERPI